MSLNLEIGQLTDKELFHIYAARMKPMLIKEALFADGTPFYCSYMKTKDGYEARLRIRTGKGQAAAVSVETEKMSYPMHREYTKGRFDYYKAVIPVCRDGQQYYYKVTGSLETVYYNKRGVMNENQDYYNFVFVPSFKTPQWARGAVFYQIFTDRFCNGDQSNDVLDREYIYINAPTKKVTDWNERPQAMDVGRFYGGDLQGIMSKLDYLKDLGVDVLYLNPIFVSPSNHKYDIQDYDYVDPHFGVIVNDEGECLADGENDNTKASRFISRVTDKKNLEASNRYFIRLVEEIHKRGMKIVLDGVFNHCGSFNKWLDRECLYEHQPGYASGAYVDENSPYHSFFKFSENSVWPYNKKYDGWWGHDTLPKLNYEQSDKLEKYILNIAKKWVSPPYNVDGWRLDVAADLGHSSEYNHQFWKKFRSAVKEANPDAIILAEHYGDPASWLQGDQWDTVMNYDAFMEPITWFLTGLEKHSDEYRADLLGNDVCFRDAMSHHMSRMHYQSLYVAMNELSNHDHSRFLTRTNRKVGRLATLGSEAADTGVNKAVMRLAVIMQMTWPGAPTIYYGDEAGVCGFTDPDSRRTYPWGHEDKELLDFHKDIIGIHKKYSLFYDGSLKYLYGQKNLISYSRFNADRQAIIVVHIGDTPVTVKIPAWETGAEDGTVFDCVFESYADGYKCSGPSYTVINQTIELEVKPQSAIIIISKDNRDRSF